MLKPTQGLRPLPETLKETIDRWEAKHPVFWRRLQKTVFFPVGFFIIAMIVVNGAVELYRDIDHSGYLTHDADTQVMFSGEWMIGEYKTCYAILVDGKPDETQDGPGPHLFCNEGENTPFHTLPVRYWGRITRPEKRGVGTIRWKCQRSSDGLTCKALD